MRDAFDHPKPVAMLQRCIFMATEPDDIVLDFFAGSGTTGHAVMLQNVTNENGLRYILIQLPELLNLNHRGQGIGVAFCDKLGKPCNIAELTKERLRRAAAKIKEENPEFAGGLGFRVFKLDTSNIRAWKPDRDDLDKSLLDHLEHLEHDRSEDDVFYEVLLKLGLDLCVPIETRAIAGTTVRSVGAGTLIACLAEEIDREAVEPLALGITEWHAELAPAGDSTVIFRDSAFADDVAKANLTAILEQHGLGNVRSL
jgi:adenine-specific DNA-methyltransferase